MERKGRIGKVRCRAHRGQHGMAAHTLGVVRRSLLPARLWHAAKRRPIDAHNRAIALRIQPIHGRVDEHPIVPVVVDQDNPEAFAKLKVLFLDASARLSWQQTCGSVRLPIPPSSSVPAGPASPSPLPHPWRKSGLSGNFGRRSESGGLCPKTAQPCAFVHADGAERPDQRCTTSPMRAAGSVQAPSSR